MFLSPQNEWSSDRIAENLGISNGYFRKIYKSMFNVSFKEDHINARISKAKKMLSDTNLTVMEIASKCGFNSASHFMRLFHQKTGETAVGFRRRR